MQVLGALLGLGGLAGFIGASSRSANVLNISVVVCIIGLLLAFQFISEARIPASCPSQQTAVALLRHAAPAMPGRAAGDRRGQAALLPGALRQRCWSTDACPG